MHHYHHRAFYFGVGCVVVIAAGLLALKYPVFLDAFDQYGFQIKCGTGFATDLSQAAAAAGEHSYVDQCETAVLTRRLWTIPPVVIASIALAVLAAVTALVWGSESAFGKDPVA
ncbi:hypothetical protein [Mycolicibacterium gadium]|jgi:hypothetical protein|uniref:Transmembrane protein n=1 Tax=Mycolicibacterium gadium TaxID=1794 RepID=A0A7I7WS25_MYCGU|nr:hypothetical protein [Mycolicibacterium gadium]MDG5486523.1 hypothetical protein [Mycolicibacterium gadium]BBZ20486.1 hypothetical protein MGAD_48210 [Mycolicibacterium gadium]